MDELNEKIRREFDAFVERLTDGLTWPEMAATFLGFVRIVSLMVKEMAASGEDKKAFVVAWALRAFDAIAAAATASLGQWWLVPVFMVVRPLIVWALPGIVQWVYDNVVKLS